MNNRPTPETNAIAVKNIYGVLSEVDVEFARKLERERDEAREQYDDLATEHVLAINRICNERDEARAVAGDLADIASKYLSFLLAVTPAKTNETHEKETMRVIDAIKRWKEL
jgi:uncharacterized coiled-coil DUF342 family protein